MKASHMNEFGRHKGRLRYIMILESNDILMDSMIGVILRNINLEDSVGLEICYKFKQVDFFV